MTGPKWRVRSATAADQALLASFRCAAVGINWQAEVESFVRNQLFDWAFDPHATSGDPRLLLLVEDSANGLVGAAAHERITLRGGDGGDFAATKLEIVALTLDWQGQKFASGERASDVLMSAVMADISARGATTRREGLRCSPRRQHQEHRHVPPVWAG